MNLIASFRSLDLSFSTGPRRAIFLLEVTSWLLMPIIMVFFIMPALHIQGLFLSIAWLLLQVPAITDTLIKDVRRTRRLQSALRRVETEYIIDDTISKLLLK